VGIISEILNENELDILKFAKTINVIITDKDIIEDIEKAGLLNKFQRCFINKKSSGEVNIMIDYDRER